mmetsp:Transcript_9798/g.35907  ORF Transcript_9798/g.35907 Transcript_9798/m.35907 type:complete len:538 (+) Transcript_9798:305-1918(+)
MRVVLDGVRHVKVDHVAHVLHVDTAPGDIGGHQNVAALVAEGVKRDLALLLRLAAVQRGALVALLLQRLGQVVARGLLVHEHNRRDVVSRCQDAQQRVQLVILLDELHVLRDVVRGAAHRTDGHHSRGAQVLTSQPLHRGRHGGTEHVGDAVHPVLLQLGLFVLWLEVGRRHRVEHFLHLRLETHVDHPVGLVKHHVVALVEHGVVGAQAVGEAARGGDDDLAALAQLQALLVDRLAAHDGHHAVVEVARELDGLLFDLLRQLPRRCHDDGVWALARVLLRHGRQAPDVLEHGQHERARLARARLRDADHVALHQAQRNGHHLDRRRLLVAHLFDGALDRHREGALLPVADGVGQAASLGGDVEVLAEDAPVALGHLVERLVRPVRVRLHVVGVVGLLALHGAALGLLFLARELHAGAAAQRGAQLLLVYRVHFLLLLAVDARAQAASEEQVRVAHALERRVGLHGGVLTRLPVEVELELLAGLEHLLLLLLLPEVLPLYLLQLPLPLPLRRERLLLLLAARPALPPFVRLAAAPRR